MPDAPYTYTPDGAEHQTFTWDGGPLIELYLGDATSPSAVIAADEIGADGHTERSAAGLQVRADEWLKTH